MLSLTNKVMMEIELMMDEDYARHCRYFSSSSLFLLNVGNNLLVISEKSCCFPYEVIYICAVYFT